MIGYDQLCIVLQHREARITELEAENATLKESNEYAWRNARTIDAARMEVEKKLLAAQHHIKELREALEYCSPYFSASALVQKALATPDNTTK